MVESKRGASAVSCFGRAKTRWVTAVIGRQTSWKNMEGKGTARSQGEVEKKLRGGRARFILGDKT